MVTKIHNTTDIQPNNNTTSSSPNTTIKNIMNKTSPLHLDETQILFQLMKSSPAMKCPVCQQEWSSNPNGLRAPISSATCPHSICLECLKRDAASLAAAAAAGAAGGGGNSSNSRNNHHDDSTTTTTMVSALEVSCSSITTDLTNEDDNSSTATPPTANNRNGNGSSSTINNHNSNSHNNSQAALVGRCPACHAERAFITPEDDDDGYSYGTQYTCGDDTTMSSTIQSGIGTLGGNGESSSNGGGGGGGGGGWVNEALCELVGAVRKAAKMSLSTEDPPDTIDEIDEEDDDDDDEDEEEGGEVMVVPVSSTANSSEGGPKIVDRVIVPGEGWGNSGNNNNKAYDSDTDSFGCVLVRDEADKGGLDLDDDLDDGDLDDDKDTMEDEENEDLDSTMRTRNTTNTTSRLPRVQSHTSPLSASLPQALPTRRRASLFDLGRRNRDSLDDDDTDGNLTDGNLTDGENTYGGDYTDGDTDTDTDSVGTGSINSFDGMPVMENFAMDKEGIADTEEEKSHLDDDAVAAATAVIPRATYSSRRHSSPASSLQATSKAKNTSGGAPVDPVSQLDIALRLIGCTTRDERTRFHELSITSVTDLVTLTEDDVNNILFPHRKDILKRDKLGHVKRYIESGEVLTCQSTITRITIANLTSAVISQSSSKGAAAAAAASVVANSFGNESKMEATIHEDEEQEHEEEASDQQDAVTTGTTKANTNNNNDNNNFNIDPPVVTTRHPSFTATTSTTQMNRSLMATSSQLTLDNSPTDASARSSSSSSLISSTSEPEPSSYPHRHRHLHHQGHHRTSIAIAAMEQLRHIANSCTAPVDTTPPSSNTKLTPTQETTEQHRETILRKAMTTLLVHLVSDTDYNAISIVSMTSLFDVMSIISTIMLSKSYSHKRKIQSLGCRIVWKLLLRFNRATAAMPVLTTSATLNNSQHSLDERASSTHSYNALSSSTNSASSSTAAAAAAAAAATSPSVAAAAGGANIATAISNNKHICIISDIVEALIHAMKCEFDEGQPKDDTTKRKNNNNNVKKESATSSEDDEDSIQIPACAAIRYLAVKFDTYARIIVRDLGGIDALLAALLKKPMKGINGGTTNGTANGATTNIAKHKNSFSSSLSSSSTNTTATINNLSNHSHGHQSRTSSSSIASSTSGGASTASSISSSALASPELSVHALGALQNLAADPNIRFDVANAGTIEATIRVMTTHLRRLDVQERGCGVLRNLALNTELAGKILELDGMGVLNNAVKRHGKESAFVQKHGTLAMKMLLCNKRRRRKGRKGRRGRGKKGSSKKVTSSSSNGGGSHQENSSSRRRRSLTLTISSTQSGGSTWSGGGSVKSAPNNGSERRRSLTSKGGGGTTSSSVSLTSVGGERNSGLGRGMTSSIEEVEEEEFDDLDVDEEDDASLTQKKKHLLKRHGASKSKSSGSGKSGGQRPPLRLSRAFSFRKKRRDSFGSVESSSLGSDGSSFRSGGNKTGGGISEKAIMEKVINVAGGIDPDKTLLKDVGGSGQRGGVGPSGLQGQGTSGGVGNGGGERGSQRGGKLRRSLLMRVPSWRSKPTTN